MAQRHLTVLFDDQCALCRRVRRWLDGQPKSFELRFVAIGSPRARLLFPQLDVAEALRDITVIDHRGRVFRGAKAWLMCLWALPAYRSMALQLSTPELMPMAKRCVAWVSRNRQQLSRFS